MRETILGINAYHGDASAALLVDGRCVAAVEEERFSRVKHQAGFPDQSVRWCLEDAGLTPGDIQHVAIGRDPTTNVWKKASYALRHPPGVEFLRSRLRNARRVMDVNDSVANALGVSKSSLNARFHRVEHHRTHIASAFFCSPFEDAACVSLDGMGDFISTMWGSGAGNDIEILGEVTHPHSLGHFYQAFTQFLGLHRYGDEFKLMGLASYGEPRFVDKLRDVLSLGDDLQFRLNLDYFVHHRRGVDMTWQSGTPEVSALWSPRVAEVFGAPREVGEPITKRDEDLAASVQKMLEEIVLEMLRRLHSKVRVPRLAMAGGVALNCVLNARIYEDTPFEEIWIQPAANDAGISLGSALWVQHAVLKRPREWVMEHAYLGSEWADETLGTALDSAGLNYKKLADDELLPRVVDRMTEGAVVGWFDGRMEYGPRALGNRSIVCDPRRPDMKDILNSRIKHREPFRPFAPSVLEERTGEWFARSEASPYMLLAYDVLPEKRAEIPAVTHVDGTGRLQTVSQEQNARYHALISEFDRRTGVPIVLNTSFNENEPIVATPQEAIDCFKRTHMDVLVLGNNLVEKTENP
jgi:carbamoyltransferase